MKIGFLPDPHVGVVKFRKSEGFMNKVTKMNDAAFAEAFEKLYSRNVDSIVIPGDLFDTPEPQVQSIVHVNNVLSKYSKELPINIISGNHDYSQKSHVNNYHVFDTITQSEDDKLSLYREKCEITIQENNDQTIAIAYVPYKALGERKAETFEKIYRALGASEANEWYKILVFHGSIDYEDEQINDEYDMPVEIADIFDFVAMGHVHYPKLVQQPRNVIDEKGNLVAKDVYHLTMGALLPSKLADQYTQRPSVYILDTVENTVEIINLDNPPHVFIYKDVVNINKTLSEIANRDVLGIYGIQYNGKMTDIDDLTYMKAIENSINISIQAEDYSESVNIKKVADFWEFIKKKYPQYENEFREVVEE